MKNFALLMLILGFLFISCKKDDETDTPEDEPFLPKQEQWGFAINYTATWCGPCGDWGAPLIHELSNIGNVIAITAHATGDPMFVSSLYTSFDADRSTGGSIPAFWIGDIKSTNTANMQALLQQIPVAGIAIQHTIGETYITIKTKTEFFNEGNGKYFLSVLILEDGIDGSNSAGDYKQNGVDNPATYKHDFVLRASSISNNAYGEEIVVSPEKGILIEKEYVISLNPNWGPNVYPVAILWQVDLAGSPTFKFVNAIK